MGQAYTVVYCMTKGAIVQMTRSLAMEYVKTPLRVNAIAPAGTNTALSKNFEIPPNVDYELMGRYTGFRDMAPPEEIAALFAFVASDEANGVHGAILSSDRGVTRADGIRRGREVRMPFVQVSMGRGARPSRSERCSTGSRGRAHDARRGLRLDQGLDRRARPRRRDARPGVVAERRARTQ
jgi:hypothetical protein